MRFLSKFNIQRLSIVLAIILATDCFAEKEVYQLQIIETPEHIVKSIMQDSVGLMWLGTYNGLRRYDGENIKHYAPTRSHDLPSNRIDRMIEHASHNILCQQRNAWENTMFYFDRKSGTFDSLPAELSHLKDIREYKRGTKSDDRWKEILASVDCPEVDRIFMHTYDRNGNLWVATSCGAWVITRQTSQFRHIDRPSEAYSFFRDNRKQVWIVSADKQIEIYDSEMKLKGYLAPDGRIVKRPCSFPYLVRTIRQNRQGTIFMAAHGDGLIILHPSTDGESFRMQQLTMDKNSPYHPDFDNIFDIHIDRYNRLWVGGLYGTLNIAEADSSGRYVFANSSTELQNAQGTLPRYIRGFLELKDDVMLILTDDGLYSCNTRFDDYSKLCFYRHRRHTIDNHPLPQNILAAAQSSTGEVLFSFGGRLCESIGSDFLSENIRFRSINLSPSSVSVAALYADDNGLVWGVTDRTAFSYNTREKSLSHHAFAPTHTERHFSPMPFFRLSDSCVVKGCREGYVEFNPQKINRRIDNTPMYISEISTLKHPKTISVDIDTSIVLEAEDRELVIHFSVLDYNRTTPIEYSYRMEGEDKEWRQTYQSYTDPYVNLSAGKYVFAVRSTNGDGHRLDNERRLHIKILPYWYEKPIVRWGMALLAILLILVGWRLIILYIRKQTQKALEKLRALQQEVSAPDEIPSKAGNMPQQELPAPEISDKNDAFSRKLLVYIDTHIADTDLKVEDLVSHLGMNRKLFVKKMKDLFNCTPIDFIIATRITRSLQYMQNDKEMSIAEIAYNSGFNDPRYFSRCFKKHTGKSPREYINELRAGAKESEK